jgi:queuine tRNA-ribosyltransferase
MRPIPFTVDASVGQARATTLTLERGTIRTPVYMPVGTQGAVRAVPPDMLAGTGAQILLANTYHLSQRPGADLVERHGGLHTMMGTALPILTDSGGFQVFSLEKTVTEEGVTFAYEVDGQRTFLSPERSMEIQQKLGSDIAMVFDECLAFGTDKAYAEASVARTTRWEARSKAAHTRPTQSLFGIVQGGFWPDLRRRSAEEIAAIGFDGYAVGGLSVGEGHQKMCDVLDFTTPYMPWNAPRYLMGVGRPLDLVEAVARGIDMFDCVIQTRHARSGVMWAWHGRVRITDRRYKKDMRPIDERCTCYVCRTFTRAYLHHLFEVGEILGATLASVHNIAWFQQFMGSMRASIEDGTFEAFRVRVREVYPEGAPVDPEGRSAAAEALDVGESQRRPEPRPAPPRDSRGGGKSGVSKGRLVPGRGKR